MARRRRPVKKLLILVFGLLFTLVGIALAVLPLIPGGFLLLPLGLVLLALLFPRVDAWMEKLVKKWPKFGGMVRKAQRRVARLVGEL